MVHRFGHRFTQGKLLQRRQDLTQGQYPLAIATGRTRTNGVARLGGGGWGGTFQKDGYWLRQK